MKSYDCRSWLGFGSLLCLGTVYGHEIPHFQHPHNPESEYPGSGLHETGHGAVMAQPFQAFSPHVNTYSDQEFLYVESNSMPHHPLMVGITAWQQQVPLPQPYVGANAWRIPLKPVPAKSHPGLTGMLYEKLLAWHEATDAPRPTKLNPNYDPKARPISGRENRGKGANRGNRQNRPNQRR